DGAAGVLCLDDRDLLRACLQPVGNLVQDLGPIRLARAWPRAGVEGRARGRDGALRVLATRARHACPGLLGSRVDRLDRLARLGAAELAIDVQLILLHDASPSSLGRSTVA